MKKRLFIIIVGIAFANVLFAQVDSTSRRKTNAVFFAPLNFFDVINPSFQIGYERTLSDKISAQIEGGVILRAYLDSFLNPLDMEIIGTQIQAISYVSR